MYWVASIFEPDQQLQGRTPRRVLKAAALPWFQVSLFQAAMRAMSGCSTLNGARSEANKARCFKPVEDILQRVRLVHMKHGGITVSRDHLPTGAGFCNHPHSIFDIWVCPPHRTPIILMEYHHVISFVFLNGHMEAFTFRNTCFWCSTFLVCIRTKQWWLKPAASFTIHTKRAQMSSEFWAHKIT